MPLAEAYQPSLAPDLSFLCIQILSQGGSSGQWGQGVIERIKVTEQTVFE